MTAALISTTSSASASAGKNENTAVANNCGTNTAPMYLHKKMLTVTNKAGPSHIAPFYAPKHKRE